jgi:hypothetical protein
VDFGFIGAGGFGEAKNCIDDSAQFSLGEQFDGGHSALGCRGFSEHAGGAH